MREPDPWISVVMCFDDDPNVTIKHLDIQLVLRYQQPFTEPFETQPLAFCLYPVIDEPSTTSSLTDCCETLKIRLLRYSHGPDILEISIETFEHIVFKTLHLLLRFPEGIRVFNCLDKFRIITCKTQVLKRG